jgi:hypothetical protein
LCTNKAAPTAWRRANFYVKNGRLREDGRLVHDMYFAEVKKPSESTGPWDRYQILGTIPGIRRFVRWQTAAARWWRSTEAAF